MGKAVSFTQRAVRKEVRTDPPAMGFHVWIHPKSRQPLGLGLLDARSAHLQTHPPRAARAGRALRAEVTREGSGGGATLWWYSINHFKVKGSKVPTSP